jgi:S1-C subfamily serine protease
MLVRPARPRAAFAGPLALTADTAGALVTSGTLAGTPLYDAGVDRGDRLVSADGRPVKSQDDWTSTLASRAPGDSIALVLRQRGRESRTVVRLTADPTLEVRPAELAGEEVSEAQRAFRTAWLASRAQPGS